MTVSNAPPVQTGDVKQQIDALRSMRRESMIWRYGALLIVAGMVVYSILTLRNSALALVQPGPGQTAFTEKLTKDLQTDVVPNVQGIATRTLTEMRPEVTASFQKLNGRTPELAEAGMQQLNLLQTNLQKQSEDVLNKTFADELKKRESKIKEMFPDATEENIQTLVTNMTAAGEKRMPVIAASLMDKHLNAMEGISNDIEAIKSSEKVSSQSDVATWEMGLAVMDLVRDDLRELAPAEAKANAGGASATGAMAPSGPMASPAAKSNATPADKGATAK